ncbi:MAG: 3'-5' exonuclease [Desulfobacterota bacterium]|nr:3'-5' exonuclease [Thermodesulfobacteriota bacterium]
MLDFFKSIKIKANSGPPPTPPLAAGLSVREGRFVVLDTELTGLDRKKDSIVSLGAVRMAGGRIEMGQTFYQLVNPNRVMKPESVVVHEITPSEVVEKPAIGPVLAEFLTFCGEAILVGHYVNMDLAFINRELQRSLGRTLGNPALDTMALVHWLKWNNPDQGPDAFSAKNFELYELAKGLGIPVQGAHNALMDAFMTAQVLQRLLPRLEQAGIKTLGELLKIGDPKRKLQAQGAAF